MTPGVVDGVIGVADRVVQRVVFPGMGRVGVYGFVHLGAKVGFLNECMACVESIYLTAVAYDTQSIAATLLLITRRWTRSKRDYIATLKLNHLCGDLEWHSS